MTSFQNMRTKIPIKGFNCHHLIPNQVVEARVFAKFFGNLRSKGFDPDEFESNGMHLPSTEAMAMTFQLPMHRGPHPRYNEFVASHVAELERMKPKVAIQQISMLQTGLRYSLRTFGASDIELRRSPMTPRLADELDCMGHLAALRHTVQRLP